MDTTPTSELTTPLAAGVSVVVPVYNSAGTLRPLVARIAAVFDAAGTPFEVILVNDSSSDDSWSVVVGLEAADARVRGFDLLRNFGQHNALLCGVRAARFDRVVTLDDDLQHPPEEIPRLLAGLAAGYDVVYGAPADPQHGLFRNAASAITKVALQTAMGADTARRVSAFRAFRTGLREAFARFGGAFVSLDVLLTWGTTRFGHVFVRHDPRRVGQSNYTVRKLVTHAMNMMTGFSTAPLQISTLLGFVMTSFGVVLLAVVVGRYLAADQAPPGFPFLASVVAIFSGAQLFSLGIIGEYLARVHSRLLDRPAYVVRARSPRRAG